jgi:uncharacterized DUF497 family protein
MRIRFDAQKNAEMRRKHGISLEDAQRAFDQTYVVDRKNDNPEQFRAIGWSGGELYSVIFEIRFDPMNRAMPRTLKKAPTADEIAAKATRGEDVSQWFTQEFTVVRPVRRVNVDLSNGMLKELDARAATLNVSRQAVIKTLLRQALDQSGRR